MTHVVPTFSFQPTIEIAHAGRLLRRVEAHHAERGWHEHSDLHVYAAYDHHDVVTAGAIYTSLRGMGEPIRNSRYAAQPVLPMRMFNRAFLQEGLQPWEGLFNFAFNAAFASTDHIRDHHNLPATAAGLDSFRRLIQLPGILGFIVVAEQYDHDGRERRIATMVDVHDRVHRVQRIRDETASLELDITVQEGEVECLRMMVDVSQGRVPADERAARERYRLRDEWEPGAFPAKP